MDTDTPKQIDSFTVAAIGVTAFLLTMIAHEAVGHGGTATVFGGHIYKVTNWYCSFGGIESAFQGRLIAMAGITLNVFVGFAAIAARRFLPRSFEPSHFFLWYIGHLNLFAAGAYMLIFSFLPFGDVSMALKDLSFSSLARIGSTALGAAMLYTTVKHCNATAIWFTGNEVGWQQRHKTLTVVPYLVGATVNVAAALIGSDGNIPVVGILISAAGSSFGAGAMFFCGEPKPRDGISNVLTPSRSMVWILIGVISLVLYYFLGRGIVFTLNSAQA